jgi:hypothetical protein
MRYVRIALSAVVVCAAAACGGGSASTSSATSTGSGTSSGAGGSSTAGDCFDYTGFDTTSPTVSFKTDVVPIFAGSCAISSACHTCATAGPGCTAPGYFPFLGVSSAAGNTPVTTAQIAAIIAATVGQPAQLQSSAIDGTMVGNPSMSIVEAGDPSKSFMTYKFDGEFPAAPTNADVNCSTLACTKTMNCGEAMPQGGPAISEDDRNTIRRWIAQGAKNN